MADAVDSDVILWGLRHHAVKQRHQQLLHSSFATSGGEKRPSAAQGQMPDTEPTVMSQLAKHETLDRELKNRYGGQTQELVTRAFSGRENGVQLIEQLLADRKQQRKQTQAENEENIRRLNFQREILINERKEVQEHVAALGSQETDRDGSVHGVDSFIRLTRENLPHQSEIVNKLRSKHLEEYVNRLKTTYRGELGPQSYQLWQMPDYYMVRGLVDRIVEKILDDYFRIPCGADRDIMRALIAENERDWKRLKYSVMESRTIQLIMEELVLLETGKLAQTVAEEFLAMWKFVKFRSFNSILTLVEGIALDSDEGRGPEDPAYNMNVGNFQKLQQGRAKYRSGQWVHTQQVHLPDAPEVIHEEEDKDASMLYMNDLVPTYLWEEEGRGYDSTEEKQNKEKLGHYRHRERLHWQAMDVTLSSLSVTKKANGVSIIRFSPHHDLVAMGTAHGDLLVYDLSWSPWRVIRVVHNAARGHDPVVDITWSLDATMLATTNQMGTSNLWSMSGSGVVMSDLKGLSIKASTDGILPEQLTHLLTLDVDQSDFSFQSGPLSMFGKERGATLYAPVMSAFHPSLTLLGTQFALCVVLENGDIIRCDMGQCLVNKDSAMDSGSRPVSQVRPQTDDSSTRQHPDEPPDALDMNASHPVSEHQQDSSQDDQAHHGSQSEGHQDQGQVIEGQGQREGAAEQSEAERNWDELETQPMSSSPQPHPTATTRILHPVIHHKEPNQLGQGIEGELLRQHKYPIVLLGCIGRIGDLVSVDTHGFIYTWKYRVDDISDFGWFQPYSKYQLDFSVFSYTPAPCTKPEVVFNDNRKIAANKLKTAQEITRERIAVEEMISQLESVKVWHADFNETTKQMTEIFKPSGRIAESGCLFHVIARHDLTDQLSAYVRQIYKPVPVRSTKFLCCVMNTTATRLVFVLLFPEHPPKEAHISIVMVDLATMSVKNFRNDIRIPEERYHQCLHDNVVACDVTSSLGTTGAEYLFLNIVGRIYAISLNTGAFVVRTEDPRHPNPDMIGCRLNLKLLNVMPSSEVVVGGSSNQIHVLLYTSGQKQKKSQSSITVLTIKDGSPEDERRLTHAAYQAWSSNSTPFPPEHRQDVITLELRHYQHPWVACRTLVLERMDAALQSISGEFTPEEIREYAKIDRSTAYQSLLAQMVDKEREEGR